MKRFDFQCTKCGHREIDKFVEMSYSSKDPLDCPKCGEKGTFCVDFQSSYANFHFEINGMCYENGYTDVSKYPPPSHTNIDI